MLKSKGVKRGDTVALMASNYPEMPAIWLGAARLGAVCPLINTNQTGNALLHSIEVAKCDLVIYGSEFDDGNTFFVTYHFHKAIFESTCFYQKHLLMYKSFYVRK